MAQDELTKCIYQGDLGKFLQELNNTALKNAYYNENWEYNERIENCFKDLTRRVHSAAFLEMLLCDLYDIKPKWKYIDETEGIVSELDWEVLRELL